MSECYASSFGEDLGDEFDASYPSLFYDYNRQAWVKDGRYLDCAHPQSMTCDCYGRLHAGEQAPESASEYLRLEAADRAAKA